MFLENTLKTHEQFGWIEIICGSMFSGKTEELIRRLNRAKYAKQKIKVFKPIIDSRFNKNLVLSHDKNQIEAKSVSKSSDIKIKAKDIMYKSSLWFFVKYFFSKMFKIRKKFNNEINKEIMSTIF